MNSEWLDYIWIPITIIAFGVSVFWTAVSFSYRPAQDVIGLNETKISTAAAMLLSWIIVLLNVGIAVRVTVAAISEHRLWLMPLSIPPILVLLATVATPLVMDFRFRAAVKSPTVKDSTQTETRLRALIMLLARELRLGRVPALRIGPDDISPFCYGRSSRHATVMLPRNLEDICLQASQNDCHTADLLMRFVVSHELSHIKNGDCAAISWLTLFYKDMKFILVAVGLCTVVYVLCGQWGDILRQATAVFLLTFLSMPFLKWAIARIARYREFVADGRSSQLFNSNEMEQLTHRKNPSVVSPLEFLVTFFSIRSKVFFDVGRFRRKRTLGFSYAALGWGELHSCSDGTGLLHRLWDAVVRLHPAMGVRQKALRNRSYAGESLPYPSWPSALQIHIIGVLCFLCLFVCLHSIIPPLVSNYIPLAEAKAITRGIFIGAATLVLICFPVLLFSMPARVSSRSFNESFHYTLSLGKRYLAGAGIGMLVLLPILALLVMILPMDHFEEIANRYLSLVRLCAFCQLIGLPLVALVVSRALYEHARLTRIQRISASLANLPWAIAMIGMIVPIVLVFRSVLLPIAFLGALIAAMYMLTKKEAGDPFQQLSAWRIGRINICLDGLAYRRWSHFLHVGIISAPSAVAAWLTALLVNPVIPLFTKIGTIGWLGALLLLSVVFFLFLVVFLEIKMLQSVLKRSLLLILSDVYLYLTILKLTGSSIPSQTFSELSKLMRGSQNASGAFPDRRGSPLAFIETNYYTVCCLDHLDSGVIDQDKLAEWVNSCRCTGGGFALYPGGHPRLAATYWALSILKQLGQMPAAKDTDIAWILERQTSEGDFLDPNSSYGPAQQTWYAVGSLELLGALEAIDWTMVGDFAKTVLKDGTVDIFEAVCAVEILGRINLLEDTVCSDVFQRFVAPVSQRIRQLPIHQNLVLLEAYARLLSETKSVDPESSKAALSVLSERVSRALQAYLQTVPGKARPRQKQGSHH